MRIIGSARWVGRIIRFCAHGILEAYITSVRHAWQGARLCGNGAHRERNRRMFVQKIQALTGKEVEEN